MMRMIFAFLLVLLVSFHPCLGQSNILINNSSGTPVSVKMDIIIDNYAGSYDELFSGEMQEKEKHEIVIEELNKFAVISVNEDIFYIEEDSEYEIDIKDSTQLEFTEVTPGINELLKSVNEQLEPVNKYKDFSSGDRESLYPLHLGRYKKRYKSVISKIKRTEKKIRKNEKYRRYNKEIDLYLLPYSLTSDFKNGNINEYQIALFSIQQVIDNDYESPFAAEAIKFLFGFSLRQFFMSESHSSNSSAIAESLRAFKKAESIIQQIPDQELKNLAFLSLVDSYYHSYQTDINSIKKDLAKEIDLLKENSNTTVSKYAQYVSTEINKLQIGNKAPEFQLISYAGDSIKLSDLRGKFIYLDFWFSRCAPCLRSMENLKNNYLKYGNNIEFVSINGFDDFITGKEISDTRGFVGRNLHAGKNHRILQDYNIQYYPTYYLISPEGLILYKPLDGYEKEFNKVSTFINQ